MTLLFQIGVYENCRDKNRMKKCEAQLTSSTQKPSQKCPEIFPDLTTSNLFPPKLEEILFLVENLRSANPFLIEFFRRIRSTFLGKCLAKTFSTFPLRQKRRRRTETNIIFNLYTCCWSNYIIPIPYLLRKTM